MDEQPIPQRFLRDSMADTLRDETQDLLNQLSESPGLEKKIDLLVRYVQEETLKRWERNCETLSRIEGTIGLLRRISPPPKEAVTMLISTANHLQAELRGIRHNLTKLLSALEPEIKKKE